MTTFEKMQRLLVQRYGLSERELFPEQSLQSLGIDSLGAIELMFDIQDEFGIEMPDSQQKVGTLLDLVAIIDKQLAPVSAEAS